VANQPADAGRRHDGPQRPLADELLASARKAVDFVSPFLQVFRGFLTHLRKPLRGGAPDGFAHFLKVVLHLPRVLAKLIACSSHIGSFREFCDSGPF
jgi:hypothetical protein